MQRVSRGYTIVELMIVLAISSLLVLMAAKFMSGSRGHTEFSQAMRDLQSQIQTWLDDVPGGYAFGSNTTAYCHASGVSVKIEATGRSALNDNPDCIFLGKAIQFTDAPSTSVYAYTVFGLRADSGGNLYSTIQDVSPVPAANSDPSASGPTGSANFTDSYTLQNGTTLKRVMQPSSGLIINSHLAGFYLSLNTDSVIGHNGETDLIAYQYPIQNYPNANDTHIVQCIENNPGQCRLVGTAPATLSNWQLCFKNNANDQTAELTIRASSNGFNPQVKLDFVAC